MNTRYTWRSGARFSAALAQPFGEWLEHHVDKSPSAILDAIKKDGNKCPVYNEVYGLSDDSAARRYRLNLVSDLLSALHQETAALKVQHRVVLPVRKSDKKRGDADRYDWHTTETIAKDSTLINSVLNDAVADLSAFARRYAQYQAQFIRTLPSIKGVFTAIAKVEKQHARKR